MVKLKKRLLVIWVISLLLSGISPAGSPVLAQDGSRTDAYLNAPILAPDLPENPANLLAEDDFHTYFPTVLNGAFLVSNPDMQIYSVSFPSDNKIRHYTTAWPDFVFRRVNWVTIQVGFSGDYQAVTDEFTWSVLEPGQANYTPIPEYRADLPDTSWAVREISTIAPYHTVEIFIPAGAALGEHRFGVSLYRSMAASSALQDLEFSPSFYVIFNPFNDDSDPRFDADVHNRNFWPVEINYFSTSSTEKNYYGKDYINFEWVYGREVIWVLNMYEPVVFLPAMEEVQGVRSAKDAVRLLAAKSRWDHRISDVVRKDSDIIDGEWNINTPGFTYNWRDAPAIMSFWNWGAAHPMGQCMDFGGLLAALVRAIGVPVRLVTCVACHGGVDYDFHVWNEVWLNEVNPGAWSAVDSMADVGPVRRDDIYFRDQLTGGIAVYTYDAKTGKRIDVKNQY